MFRSLLYFFILTVLVFAGVQQMPVNYLLKDIYVVVLFFVLSTLLALILSFVGIKKSGNASVLVILSAFVIKLLASLFFVLIYLHNNQVNKIIFVSNFFALYILFSLFEIYSLLANLRDQKNTIESSNK